MVRQWVIIISSFNNHYICTVNIKVGKLLLEQQVRGWKTRHVSLENKKIYLKYNSPPNLTSGSDDWTVPSSNSPNWKYLLPALLLFLPLSQRMCSQSYSLTDLCWTNPDERNVRRSEIIHFHWLNKHLLCGGHRRTHWKSAIFIYHEVVAYKLPCLLKVREQTHSVPRNP